MNIEKIFKELEKKLLNKEKLSLKDKILLERVKNKDINLIVGLLNKKLQKIKAQIDELYSKQFDKSFTENEKIQLEKLQNQKNKILSIIKEHNSQKTKLKSSDFTWSDIAPSFEEILNKVLDALGEI